MVLNPRCSLNHLAMLPAHCSKVRKEDFVPLFLTRSVGFLCARPDSGVSVASDRAFPQLRDSSWVVRSVRHFPFSNSDTLTRTDRELGSQPHTLRWLYAKQHGRALIWMWVALPHTGYLGTFTATYRSNMLIYCTVMHISQAIKRIKYERDFM